MTNSGERSGPTLRFESRRFGSEGAGFTPKIDVLHITFHHDYRIYNPNELSPIFGRLNRSYILLPDKEIKIGEIVPAMTTFAVAAIPKDTFVPWFSEDGIHIIGIFKLFALLERAPSELPKLIAGLDEYRQGNKLVEAQANLVELAISGIRRIADLNVEEET